MKYFLAIAMVLLTGSASLAQKIHPPGKSLSSPVILLGWDQERYEYCLKTCAAINGPKVDCHRVCRVSGEGNTPGREGEDDDK